MNVIQLELNLKTLSRNKFKYKKKQVVFNHNVGKVHLNYHCTSLVTG